MTSEQREEMGGRKVNLNHLLNFTYEHEETFYSSGRVGFRSKTIARDSVYNKEQFIQSKLVLIVWNFGFTDNIVSFALTSLLARKK